MADSRFDVKMGDRLARKIARVDAALTTPWWRSRLGNRLDAYVDAVTAAANAQTCKFWIIVLASVQLLGLLRDIGFGLQGVGLILRGMLVLPVLLVIAVVLGRRPSRGTVAWLTSLAVIMTLGVQILLALIAAQPFSDRYLMGAVFAFSIMHLVMPFSYKQIVTHAIIVGSAVGLAALVCKGDGDTSVMDRLEVILPVLSLVAAAGALRMRHGRRRSVLMDLRSALQADALEHANRSLAKLLRQDTLTGVFNRRYFDETMESMWRRMRAAGKSFGIILIDVDRFKRFNDSMGHQAGDQCLKQVAHCLDLAVRDSDRVVARYGGEEFAVVLGDAACVDAHAIGDRLRRAVEALALAHPQGGVVTVSVGVAACVPDEGRDFHALVDAADKALYASKEAGRNCVTAGFLAADEPAPPETHRAATG